VSGATDSARLTMVSAAPFAKRTKIMKCIFIDVETTGIACPQSGLVQLAGMVEMDGEIVETFEYRMQPFPGDVIEEEALAVNGLTPGDLATYPAPGEVFAKFVALLDRHVDRYDRADKFLLVAYNAPFDAEHLRAWFRKNEERYFGSWFWHPAIDVMGLAAAVLMKERPSLPDFKLLTVARAMGLEADVEKAHDAVYDVSLTRELFLKLLERVEVR